VNLQFQDEPILTADETVSTTGRRLHIERSQVDLQDVSPAEVATLLFGLKLRGWLDSAEREFLGRLGFEQVDWFVVDGDSLVHSTDQTLFPLELLDPARNQGADAMFRHRFYPAGNQPAAPRMIATANLSIFDGAPLMIGMCGPEHIVCRPDVEAHFESVTSVFRASLSNVETTLQTVRSQTAEAVPTAVVNRSTGRLVYLNSLAAKLAGKDQQTLVGLEFQKVRDLLPTLLSGGGLKIKDINSNELSLSVITAVQNKETSRRTPAQIADFVLHEARNKLTTIMTAAGYIDAMASDVKDSDGTSVTGIVLDEAEELNCWLYRLNLIVAYDHLSKVPVDFTASWEKALESTSQSLQPISVRSAQPELLAPPDSLAILFEAILSAHGMAADEGQTPLVQQVGTDSAQEFSLRLTTQVDPAKYEKRSFRFWHDFAIQLASVMKIDLENTVSGESRLLTTLTIK